MIAVRRPPISILVWCLGGIESGRKDLLKEAVECFTQRWQGCNEDTNGQFCRTPYAEVDTGPSGVSRLGDGLQLDRLEYRADCGTVRRSAANDPPSDGTGGTDGILSKKTIRMPNCVFRDS